jgi:hypothetical protein
MKFPECRGAPAPDIPEARISRRHPVPPNADVYPIAWSAAVTRRSPLHSGRCRIPDISVVIMVTGYAKTMIIVVSYANSGSPVREGARTLARSLGGRVAGYGFG